MRVVLVNPPYQTLTSNLGTGHQVPLGLLMVGGALIDAGHDVRLIDAECEHLSNRTIAKRVLELAPAIVLTGHAGSTPAHLVCMKMFRAIRQQAASANVGSKIITVYGGVYPTYHAASILQDNPAVDIVVRGEGEATAVDLVYALMRAASVGEMSDSLLKSVPGIAFRNSGGQTVVNEPRPPIADLDQYRTGWELIHNWDRYTCFGLGRAAIMQYSRGCPHRCTYCGQHAFWVKWRRRSPIHFVDEIERLHREHDIRFITLADENPTTIADEWRSLLAELASRKLPVKLFATMRATDIVRDADFMQLYADAGILYVLMGIESTDSEVIEQIKKGSTVRDDYRACQLLREYGIYSIIGHIVGLGDETWARLKQAQKALAMYDGDYLNAMYVTPHSWTPFAQQMSSRPVAQENLSMWDYRHQILHEPQMKPWELFLGVKWLELRFHMRTTRLKRMLTEHDAQRRQQLWWAISHTGLVWLGEVIEFALTARSRRASKDARTLNAVAKPRPYRALTPLRVKAQPTAASA